MSQSRPLTRAARRTGYCLPLIFLAVAVVPACRITDITLWRPAELPAGEALAVERIADVAYTKQYAKDPQTLDLFVPKGRTGYPVVVLVHGGAWIMGDNRCCGL